MKHITHRSIGRFPNLFMSLGLILALGLSGPALGARPSLSGLQQQIDDLDQRLTDCEQGVDGACPGSTGPQGPPGEDATRGLLFYFEIGSLPETLSAQSFPTLPVNTNFELTCPDRTTIAGGGYLSDQASAFQVLSSRANFSNNSWKVRVFYEGLAPFTMELRAVCSVYIPPGETLNDSDLDEIPDFIDNCPSIFNTLQVDFDRDGIGDACEQAALDPDIDGVLTADDNCPIDFNPNQTDSDNDGLGDVCDPTPNGEECSPGQAQTRFCGTPPAGEIICTPGTQTRRCSTNGVWSSWGLCSGLETSFGGGFCPWPATIKSPGNQGVSSGSTFKRYRRAPEISMPDAVRNCGGSGADVGQSPSSWVEFRLSVFIGEESVNCFDWSRMT